MKDKEAKKKKPLLPLPFFQQLPINLPDLPKHALNVGEAAEPVFHLPLQVPGDGDLANTALALAHRQNPDRAMSFPALLTTATAGLVAPHHRLMSEPVSAMLGSGMCSARRFLFSVNSATRLSFILYYER